MDKANWKKLAFRLLPTAIQSPIVTALTKYRIARVNKLETPNKITFFVTNRCNARCKHCFYSKQLSAKKSDLSACDSPTQSGEINLDQIHKLSLSLKHPIDLNLTGGEPFLRTDLLEICKIFCQTPKVRFLYLPTNGLLPERILNVVEQILGEYKLTGVYVQVSLDGPEKIHDKIRNVEGCFKKAIETIGLLKKLQNRYKNLCLKTATVISGANYERVDEVVQALLPLQVPHTFMLTRGSHFGVYNLPKDVWSNFDPVGFDGFDTFLLNPAPQATQPKGNSNFVPVEALPGLYSTLRELNQNSETKFWSKEEQLRLAHSIDMITRRRKLFPCYAGKAEGVIYPNGDVSFCEMTKPFGNLRSTNFDLHKLWHSQAADAMRRKIERCFCIHDCNLSTSMSMHAETILKRLSGEFPKNDSELIF